MAHRRGRSGRQAASEQTLKEAPCAQPRVRGGLRPWLTRAASVLALSLAVTPAAQATDGGCSGGTATSSIGTSSGGGFAVTCGDSSLTDAIKATRVGTNAPAAGQFATAAGKRSAAKTGTKARVKGPDVAITSRPANAGSVSATATGTKAKAKGSEPKGSDATATARLAEANGTTPPLPTSKPSEAKSSSAGARGNQAKAGATSSRAMADAIDAIAAGRLSDADANAEAASATGDRTKANGQSAAATVARAKVDGVDATATGSLTHTNGKGAAGDRAEPRGSTATTTTGSLTRADMQAVAPRSDRADIAGDSATATDGRPPANGGSAATTGKLTYANGLASAETDLKSDVLGARATATPRAPDANAANATAPSALADANSGWATASGSRSAEHGTNAAATGSRANDNAAQAQAQVSMPSAGQILLLVRTSLLTLNDAIRTGNFTLLHEVGAPSFRKANSPVRLARIFSNLVSRRIDLASVAVMQPTLTEAPALDQATGQLMLRGTFPAQTQQIDFLLAFQPVAGDWRLSGMAVDVKQARASERKTVATRNAGGPAGPAKLGGVVKPPVPSRKSQ